MFFFTNLFAFNLYSVYAKIKNAGKELKPLVNFFMYFGSFITPNVFKCALKLELISDIMRESEEKENDNRKMI